MAAAQSSGCCVNTFMAVVAWLKDLILLLMWTGSKAPMSSGRFYGLLLTKLIITISVMAILTCVSVTLQHNSDPERTPAQDNELDIPTLVNAILNVDPQSCRQKRDTEKEIFKTRTTTESPIDCKDFDDTCCPTCPFFPHCKIDRCVRAKCEECDCTNDKIEEEFSFSMMAVAATVLLLVGMVIGCITCAFLYARYGRANNQVTDI